MNKSGAGRARVQLGGEGRAPSEIVRCEISQLSGAGINLDPGISQRGSISRNIFKSGKILIQNSLLRKKKMNKYSNAG